MTRALLPLTSLGDVLIRQAPALFARPRPKPTPRGSAKLSGSVRSAPSTKLSAQRVSPHLPAPAPDIDAIRAASESYLRQHGPCLPGETHGYEDHYGD